MKILLTLVFVFTTSPLLAQHQPQEIKLGWYKQESGNTNYLFQVQFTSRDTGYVTGSAEVGGDVRGYFYRTTNGGESWHLFGPPELGGFFFFLNASVGWVNAGTNGLYYTEDAGNNWEVRQTPKGGKIKFYDKNIGWGISGLNFSYTTDGGKKWNNQGPGPGNGSLEDLTVFDSMSMLGVGAYYPTNDGCASLVYDSLGYARKPPIVCLQANLHAVDNLNDKIVVAVAGSIVYRSNNQGFHWEEIKDSAIIPKPKWGVDFSDDHNGTLVGSGGTIARTVNGGTTWTGQTSTTSEDLEDVHFLDSLNGAAVGAKGTILHTTNAGQLWVKQLLPNDPFNSRFYPEPANALSTLYFNIPHQEHITISIFDATGKLIAQPLVASVLAPGKHEFPFNCTSLTEGTYFYRIECGSIVGSGRLTVVR